MMKKDSLVYCIFVAMDYISNLFGIGFSMKQQNTGETNAAVVVFTATAVLPYIRAHVLGSLYF